MGFEGISAEQSHAARAGKRVTAPPPPATFSRRSHAHRAPPAPGKMPYYGILAAARSSATFRAPATSSARNSASSNFASANRTGA